MYRLPSGDWFRLARRAGLDYWPYVFVKCHESWEDFLAFFEEQEGPKRLVGFSKKCADAHTEPGAYKPGDWYVRPHLTDQVAGLIKNK